jgi:hypothetical protein
MCKNKGKLIVFEKLDCKLAIAFSISINYSLGHLRGTQFNWDRQGEKMDTYVKWVEQRIILRDETKHMTLNTIKETSDDDDVKESY